MSFLDRIRQQIRALGGADDRPDGGVADANRAAPDPAAVANDSLAAAVLVIGLFARATDAEQALNNLNEAGYDPGTISVVASGPQRARTLTDIAGPLSSLTTGDIATALASRGLGEADAAAYELAIESGAILIGVYAPDGSEQSAGEILSGEHGDQVHILPRSMPG